MEAADNAKGNPASKDKLTGKMDLRMELARFEVLISELKTEYEQYFLDLIPRAPEKLHKQTERLLRELRKAPFKTSEMSYRLRALESRFRTYNTYWKRTLREKEEGTYSKDVFKANLREKNALEDAYAATKKGKKEGQLRELFRSYQSALEKQTGKKQNINFDSFQKNIVQRAKQYKKASGGKKISFKVVVKNGKVTVQAKTKD